MGCSGQAARGPVHLGSWGAMRLDPRGPRISAEVSSGKEAQDGLQWPGSQGPCPPRELGSDADRKSVV